MLEKITFVLFAAAIGAAMLAVVGMAVATGNMFAAAMLGIILMSGLVVCVFAMWG